MKRLEIRGNPAQISNFRIIVVVITVTGVIGIQEDKIKLIK